jgi:hypothetical protein
MGTALCTTISIIVHDNYSYLPLTSGGTLVAGLTCYIGFGTNIRISISTGTGRGGTSQTPHQSGIAIQIQDHYGRLEYSLDELGSICCAGIIRTIHAYVRTKNDSIQNVGGGVRVVERILTVRSVSLQRGILSQHMIRMFAPIS